MTSVQSLENSLKSIYLGVISEKLNNADPFLSSIKNTTADIWGKEIRKTVFNKVSKECFNLVEKLENFYCSFKIDDKVLRLSSTSPIVDILNSEIDTSISNYKKDITQAVAEKLHLLFTSEVVHEQDRNAYKKLQPHICKKNIKIDYMSIQEMVDSIDSDIDMIYCSVEFRQEYQKNMIEQKQNIDYMQLSNGYKCISWNGIPIVVNTNIKGKTAYFIDTKTFSFHQLCDWRFLEDDKGRIVRQMQNKPSYEVTIVKYANLVCNDFSQNGLWISGGIETQ